MTEYKTLIDNFYNTINNKTINDADRSVIIIKGITDTMAKSKTNKQDISETSCSSFTNNIVKFVCKLDKYKDKICNIPSAIYWVIGKQKIDTIINFITTNDTFSKTVIDKLYETNGIDEINKLLDNITKNIQLNQKNSSDCISNIQSFLNRLRTNAVKKLSSSSSVSSVSDLTSRDSLSSISSVNSSSRPSSTSSEISITSSRPSSTDTISSTDSKRFGIRLSSIQSQSPQSSDTNKVKLTEFQKNPYNMYSDENDPNKLYSFLEEASTPKTGGKKIRSKKIRSKKIRSKKIRSKKIRRTQIYTYKKKTKSKN
jgi:hypothetical protein